MRRALAQAQQHLRAHAVEAEVRQARAFGEERLAGVASVPGAALITRSRCAQSIPLVHAEYYHGGGKLPGVSYVNH